DKETTAAPVAEKTVESTEPEEPSEDASSPEIVADRIIMALKERDVGALENLMCPDAKEKLKGVVGETDADSVDLVGEIRQVNEDEAKFDMTLTMSGAPFSAYARLAKLGGEWCWGGMTIVPAQESDVKAERPSTPEIPGMPTEADALEAGRKLAKQLGDKINNGDAAGTRALFCDGDNRLVENIMKWQPKIVMGGDDRRFRHESVDRSHRIEVRRAERQGVRLGDVRSARRLVGPQQGHVVRGRVQLLLTNTSARDARTANRSCGHSLVGCGSAAAQDGEHRRKVVTARYRRFHGRGRAAAAGGRQRRGGHAAVAGRASAARRRRRAGAAGRDPSGAAVPLAGQEQGARGVRGAGSGRPAEDPRRAAGQGLPRTRRGDGPGRPGDPAR